MIRVTFVRHGESVSNAAGRWQGQSDVPLSPRGRDQALHLARRLRSSHFDVLLTSDLQRAADTARALGRPVEVDPELREIHVGAWEGLAKAEVMERYPDDLAALARGEDIALGGGERWSDVDARTDRALERLLGRLEPGAHALVFTHGGWIRCAFAGALGVRTSSRRPLASVANTGLGTLRFDDEPQIERYNDATHLLEEPWSHPHGVWTRWVTAGLSPSDALISLRAAEDSTEAAEAGMPDAAGVLRVPADLEGLRESHAGTLLERSQGAPSIAKLLCNCFPQGASWLAPPAQSLTVMVATTKGVTLGAYAMGP